MQIEVDGKPVDYSGLPEGLREPMRRYMEERHLAGDFLRAVLQNNLTEAFGRADDNNRFLLYEIVRWLYNNAPAECYGSRDKVAMWLSPEKPLTDAQRLDWIEAKLHGKWKLSMDFRPSVFVCVGEGLYKGDEVYIDVRGEGVHQGKTIRDAIDEAIREIDGVTESEAAK